MALVNTQIENTTLRAVLSRGFVNQYLVRCIQILVMMAYTEGNPDLKTETSESAELGVRYVGDKLFLDTAVFYTEAENYIDRVMYDTVNSLYKWKNMDEATTFGAEMMLSYDFLEDVEREISPYVNLTAMRRKFNDDYDTGYPSLTSRFGVRAESCD